MQITMVKKRLASGEPCGKCVQAESFLQSRGLLDRIDRVVWAEENDVSSEGMRLASTHGVELAPFFIVENDTGPRVVTSVLELVKKVLAAPRPREEREPAAPPTSEELPAWVAHAASVPEHDAQALVRLALERFGKECVIAFSGAEDVALIEMAAQTGLPYSVMTLDTGRLNPETYRFFDEVRQRYALELDVLFPDPAEVERLVREKGFQSFYQDGHKECCTIRKVRPLARGLRRYRAWMTGQRRDQSPTRSEVSTAELDTAHEGLEGPLVKLNPLAAWDGGEVWSFLRDRGVPTNELHRRGYISIGCEPCTRPVLPHEHERAGRWWWEDTTQRECGLHVARLTHRG